ncbi:ATP synthase F0, B subunit [Alkaliphilus metalliredigens QYMF]|uniref:ATP synthase subunit b n=1 Tax=Alkaliphilus metalliredigens (strain QYMF) TaxID=293826 RepID=ATPF_ALKMQ|nr:F0F1 ATP synthase subunit B [Alkaliphilus metalliredigens]A6TK61.1 RecName: Full=ATP synthase subunit b; AltName: Full=ATP synthase F(0) sector subunit b; AltName: Full=ATPase subunit I; AltName: Full=F-type ATPase subunit b; Short=F-ATPase subunit b [Alkaliphilus metalliredigens QYMF]ABR46579.1 ATP synthase F0, B subunit [Alkaliphilus metalliredigens QYMF]
MQGLVEFVLSNFIFTLINLWIMYWVLKKFLFKPTTEYMEGRKKSIADSIQEAEMKNKEADESKAQYDMKLQDIKKERSQIIDEATKRAEKRGDEIIKAAEDEAEKVIERAMTEIQREKQKSLNEMKNEISQLAIAAATKVIEKDLDEGTHHKMIQQFIDEVGETKWQN